MKKKHRHRNKNSRTHIQKENPNGTSEPTHRPAKNIQHYCNQQCCDNRSKPRSKNTKNASAQVIAISYNF